MSPYLILAAVVGLCGVALQVVALLSVWRQADHLASLTADVQESQRAMLKAAGEVMASLRDTGEVTFLRSQVEEATRFARALQDKQAAVITGSQSNLGPQVVHKVVDEGAERFRYDRSGMAERPAPQKPSPTPVLVAGPIK